MEFKRYSSIWVALLGIAVGALAVLTVDKYKEPRAAIKAEYGDWRKLNLVLQTIENKYVDTIDYKKVTDDALFAILSSLDPHSMYMPPADLEASESELAGNFDGIGIQFNVPNDTAIVLEVISGGPSEKIGLQQGDRILKVNEKVIAGVKFPQDSIVSNIKGPAGTKVTVTVLRDGQEIPFEITRGKIPVNCVDAAFMLNDTTGYIRLSKFSRNTVAEVSSAAVELLADGMKELVFDLRDNTGGYLDQALLLCNMFLEKGDMLFYMEGLHQQRESVTADGTGILKDVGLKVLINESSASSSEIFAGAVQDNDRGVIVGRRSFGKGLVQEPFYFTDGSGIRLTVARYFTPSGRCIQKPYSDDYMYDLVNRYADGEMLVADSIKVNKDETFYTVGGRPVYGGGGIVPDVFVPMDTTSVPDFYVECTRKATQMRFASAFFDSHKKELSSIDNFHALGKYLDSASLESEFLNFASSVDGLGVSKTDWDSCKPYMMTQVRALVGRYSKLGDNAYFHIYVDIDETIKVALQPYELEFN